APFMRYPSRLSGELLFEQMDNGLRQADGFGDALQTVIETDIRERLGRIQLPTLVVGGLSDRVVPVAAAVSLHRRIPHSRLEIFERTGHVPQLERPLRFNALVSEFLGS
ncbi:MAG TPA: alpha/beta fold hydrolase, partial [Solirubrobacterales bacterium]|nr:alpha/beta fold hydrolase [Solirubrobacterales bacterium]